MFFERSFVGWDSFQSGTHCRSLYLNTDPIACLPLPRLVIRKTLLFNRPLYSLNCVAVFSVL